jgi:hypothetical protein
LTTVFATVPRTRWRRTEERAGGAKSAFHVQGSVAKSAHAGRLLWRFDRWDIPVGAWPSLLWSRGFARQDRTSDQHDAYSIAVWLLRADRDGSLAALLNPGLPAPGRMQAQVERWILRVFPA